MKKFLLFTCIVSFNNFAMKQNTDYTDLGRIIEHVGGRIEQIINNNIITYKQTYPFGTLHEPRLRSRTITYNPETIKRYELLDELAHFSKEEQREVTMKWSYGGAYYDQEFERFEKLFNEQQKIQ